jgi:hypothetical protein
MQSCLNDEPAPHYRWVGFRTEDIMRWSTTARLNKVGVATAGVSRCAWQNCSNDFAAIPSAASQDPGEYAFGRRSDIWL